MDEVELLTSREPDRVRFEQLRAISGLINSPEPIRKIFVHVNSIRAHLRPEVDMYLGTTTEREADRYQFTFVKCLREYLESNWRFKRTKQINKFAGNIKVGDGVPWFIGLLQSLWHLKNDSGEAHQVREKEQTAAILVSVYNEIKFTELCLRSIRKLAGLPHHIVAVNNSTKDLGSFKKAVVGEGLVDEWFDTRCTKHGDGLQKALGLVRRFRYIATVDSDAIGLKEDWLRDLVEQLNSKKAGLIGPVRGPRLRDIISFAIHPCCMIIDQERIASKFHIDFRDQWPYWDSGGLLTWDCLLNDIPIVEVSHEHNGSYALHSTLVNKSVRHYWYASRISALDNDAELDGCKVRDIRQRLAREYQSPELDEIKQYRLPQEDIVSARHSSQENWHGSISSDSG